MNTNPTWSTRQEEQADIPGIRAVHEAAFPSRAEADLVEELRTDEQAWIPELSVVATDGAEVVGHVLLSRCHIGAEPALALAPCGVLPDYQRQGVGHAAIEAALKAARELGEEVVVVLGQADYYPRFGFEPAAQFGVLPPFDVPDENFMVLTLGEEVEIPQGLVSYASAFEV